MAASIVSGILGSVAVLAIGFRGFDLPLPALVQMVVVSNLAAFLGVWGTIRLEGVAWFKKNVLTGSWATWGFLSVVYLLVLALGSPEFRNFRVASALLVPLIVATGFSFPVYGWVQDRYVRRRRG